jgi:DNA-binding NtrC family response regulator
MTDVPGQPARNRQGFGDAPAPVLVVEDEMLIQMLAVEYIEELGLTAETASTAAEAKTRLAALQGRAAAVLVDVGLPDEPGDILVGALRAVYPNLPVIFASGQSEAALRDRFKGQAAIGFLPKPYILEQMRSALAEAGVFGSSATRA